MLKFDRLSVELLRLLVFEDFTRNGASGGRKEVIVPVLDPLDRAEMFLRVVLRNDLGSYRMKPLVAIGVIEVPVRVHEVGDGVGAKISKSVRHLGPRHGNTPSIRTLPSGRVSTATFPPDPSSALMLFRSLWVVIGEAAALSLIRLTSPRASANASRGVSQPPVATKVRQQQQKPRRDIMGLCGVVMRSSSIKRENGFAGVYV